jgi:hypothetical protein
VKIINNLVIVPVSINGSPPFNFILDTGVNKTILTEPVIAEFFDVYATQDVLIYGLGGEGMLQAAKATDVTIQLGPIRGTDMDLIIIPEDILQFSSFFGISVYGIIGNDIFRKFPVKIDYSAAQVTIYREPSYRTGRRFRELPIELIGGKPYTTSTLTSQTGQTLTTELLIDLGASHPIYLNQKYNQFVDKTLEGFLGEGIGGMLTGEMGRIGSLDLAGFVLREPIVAFPQTEIYPVLDDLFQWEGIIGGGILSRFTLILDYQSSKIVLRPNRKFKSPFYFNPSGIEIKAVGTKFQEFIIYYVREGSPAYEAGLREGDRILSIKRKHHSELDLQTINYILSGRDVRRIRMQILREDIIQTIRFTLRDEI